MEAVDWFEHLATIFPNATGQLAADERDALLDLARIAAHTSERWTAPVSTYIAGLTLATVDPSERALRLRALVDELEAPDTPRD